MIWKKVNPPAGDYFFAGEALSAPCGGTSPKGGGKVDGGTDCRVGLRPPRNDRPPGGATGASWLPLWGSCHGFAVTERAEKRPSLRRGALFGVSLVSAQTEV